MTIFLTLKCGINDSIYFIKQLSVIQNVGKVIVFRDLRAKNLPKVEYITNWSQSLLQLNFIIRFWQMVFRIYLKPKVIIGIYEIPHGLLAVLIGRIFNIPSAVSIIGNPAYSKLRKGFRMKLTMWILKNTNFITVTGSTSKRFLINKGIPVEKIHILPNTMDFEDFYPMPNIPKVYDIISLGRLSEEKKVHQVINVIAKLKKYNHDIKAAIAGSGPEKENILNLINDLDLQKNIDILGYIPDNELSEFFNKGKVFLLTSETEGFPRTIIQAAACGVAVVATNVGDMTDVIDHEVNGLLVDSYKDIDSFVKYSQILLSNPALAESYVTNLDRKVRIQFANEQATIVWKKIIDEISKRKL